jgi:hypothetical protein
MTGKRLLGAEETHPQVHRPDPAEYRTRPVALP